MTTDLVAFVRARFEEELEKARYAGDVVGRQPERFGVEPEDAAKHARFSVAAAEARLVLLADTVVPYLGTAGPGGRNAEFQLRLLAAPYVEHRDYPHDEGSAHQPGSPA
ncbi:MULTISPECIES: DUF6221 family protein [Streptomyces]|uniref:DUF6221 family protein n=1 Tax=Streptomyces glycanivorans TaxID=3033808 RepID=A0ABY9J560_9ACTN|nr:MULTISPECIES: DUF6221 family protein [unclassified Streptomyces]WSQ75826.1 DUF6221 family protein [Streptomyces sp. NBC_01213]TXS12742.1 hypothetical protein EAO68_21615 [Streptomyces sp. wa22]WLQ62320.1 DUF6221 family protein [Streptomyces sp. Alt3]WSQ83074.1 DUF6221 family protein [Streptomyces sp. NBC_01212]WSR10898.1 DUF6221 family protein [Streptomyces sp. NBC_01208]